MTSYLKLMLLFDFPIVIDHKVEPWSKTSSLSPKQIPAEYLITGTKMRLKQSLYQQNAHPTFSYKGLEKDQLLPRPWWEGEVFAGRGMRKAVCSVW